MSTVVMVGESAVTTTGLLLAATSPPDRPVVFAECDPSGGDLAAWAELRDTPGWSTAVASGDRSWPGLRAHLQQMPSGLNVLVAPTLAGQAEVVVREASHRFGSMLRALSEVTVIADCGRMGVEPPLWTSVADVVLLVVHQTATSPGATVARVDRAREALGVLSTRGIRVATMVIGVRPYAPAQVADVLGSALFGVLPEDPAGAGLAAGAWTVGRGASRSALARAARPLAATVADMAAGSVVPLPREASDEVAG